MRRNCLSLLKGPDRITNSVLDLDELGAEAPKAPVPWETLQEAAQRISDDVAHLVIPVWAECED